MLSNVSLILYGIKECALGTYAAEYQTRIFFSVLENNFNTLEKIKRQGQSAVFENVE